MADDSRNFLSIQYLRGLAALLVVISHAFGYPLVETPPELIKTGRLGVLIFFVISGFIMVLSTGAGTFSGRRFLARRAIRVLPLYYLFTTLIAVACIFAPTIFKDTQLSVSHYLLSLAFAPHFRPGDGHSIEPLFRLGWTLNYEIFFYVIFSLMGSLAATRRAVSLFALFAAMSIIGLSLPSSLLVTRFYLSPILLSFALGALLGLIVLGRAEARRVPGAMLLGLLAAIAVATFCLTPWSSLAREFGGRMLSNVTGALIVSFFVVLELNGRMFKINPLKWIGDSSYSLYLAHMFAVAAVWMGLREWGLLTDAYYLAGGTFAVLAGVAAGGVSYHLLERPMSENLSRIFLKRPGDRISPPRPAMSAT